MMTVICRSDMARGKVLANGQWVEGRLERFGNVVFIVNKFVYQVDPDTVEEDGTE